MIVRDDFIASMEGSVGFDVGSFIDAHHDVPSVSLRINHAKLSTAELKLGVGFSTETILNGLQDSNIVPWCNSGYYLDERPVFTLDPLIHAGAYYVQEASSMFIDYALRTSLGERTGLKALDLCAAPGGKTTLLANLPHIKLLLANEIIQSRVPILYENVVKWGRDHVFVSNNDPRDIGKLSGFFDVILVDAPCSGSGLFRKDPSAMDQWNTDLVGFCSVRQKRILEDIYPALSENGILVYSTCSYSQEENEANVDMLLSAYGLESIQIPVPPTWGVIETQSPLKGGYGYRFYPDKVKGEGFFCSILIKKEVAYQSDFRPRTAKNIYKSDHLNMLMKHPENHVFYLHEKDVFAVNSECYEDFIALQAHLNLKRSGLRIGSLVRDEILPDHELAMSMSKQDSLPACNLSYEEALHFLRKSDMGLEISERGWMLVKWNNIALGWIKSIPRRLNNYYPTNWRILMQK